MLATKRGLDIYALLDFIKKIAVYYGMEMQSFDIANAELHSFLSILRENPNNQKGVSLWI
jgi:hypothetical protein